MDDHSIQKQNVKKNRHVPIKFNENLRNAAHKEVVGEAHDAERKAKDRRQNDAADRNQQRIGKPDHRRPEMRLRRIVINKWLEGDVITGRQPYEVEGKFLADGLQIGKQVCADLVEKRKHKHDHGYLCDNRPYFAIVKNSSDNPTIVLSLLSS